MEQRGIAPGTGEWFLIASQGDMVARVRPGTFLGETAAGELTFDPSAAQLELDIAYDGSLVLSAVDDCGLESAGGTRSRCETLPRHRGAEISLPHNVLKLDTDFANPNEADDIVEIRIVRLTEHIAEPTLKRTPATRPDDPVDPAVQVRPPRPTRSKAKTKPARPKPRPKSKSRPQPQPQPRPIRPVETETEPPEPAQGGPLPRPTVPQPPSRTVDEGMVEKAAVSIERTGVRRQRTLSPVMAALIGLAAIALALLYPVLREDGLVQTPVAVDADPAPQTEQRTSDAAIDLSPPDSGVTLTMIRVPPVPLRLVDLPPVAPTTAPSVELIEVPAVEYRSMQPVAQTTEQPAAAPETEAAAPVVDNQPDPALVAELEEIGESALALIEKLAQRRDLVAADLALAQGRLTSPPEANAYTLYNRILAQQPESAEARSGLQSVQQQLINRTLAQLAGGRLDDARSSLQAAADAGADPRLVTDLHAEIDYRQRLTNTRNQ